MALIPAFLLLARGASACAIGTFVVYTCAGPTYGGLPESLPTVCALCRLASFTRVAEDRSLTLIPSRWLLWSSLPAVRVGSQASRYRVPGCRPGLRATASVDVPAAGWRLPGMRPFGHTPRLQHLGKVPVW